MAEGQKTAKVLLFSDDSATRQTVISNIGRRAAKDVAPIEWDETATGAAVIEKAHTNKYDLLILDGEAPKTGAMGLSRQLHQEIFDCPPTLILIGRQQDGWLANWGLADAYIPAPYDQIELQEVVARLLRGNQK